MAYIPEVQISPMPSSASTMAHPSENASALIHCGSIITSPARFM